MISDNAILSFIKECEANENINLINFILIHDGDIITHFCKEPYKKESKQLLFSMTKSFASFAIGIAYDKGLLKLDDFVTSFFDTELPENPHPNLAKMRIRHLLSMTVGIHDNTYAELFPQKNWIKAFLAQEFPHEPGTFYRYSTHATHMLSAIIEKVSGQNLADFLNANMLWPMEINDAQWEYSPEGLIAGGMGLSLRPSDLAKVAIMLLNNGTYNNQRIISEEYLLQATSVQAIKQDEVNANDNYFSGTEYGYQIHISPNGVYRAEGAFGQYCLIHPTKKIAVIATSQRTKTECFLALVGKHLIKDSMPSEHKRYKMDENELNIKIVELMENYVVFEFENGIVDYIAYDFQKPIYGHSHFVKDIQIHKQAHCVYASCSQDNCLLITIYYIETPYVAEYTFKPNADKLTFGFGINVSLSLKGFTVSGSVK